MRQGWLRRRYMWYLKRHKVLELQAKRHGQCARCGRCCSYCIFHDGKRGACRISRHRPEVCRMFPLTPEDIEHITTCGFSFRD